MNATPLLGCADFGTFLNSPSQVNTIDLSHSTLLECIDTRIKVKSLRSPNFGKKYHSCIKSIRNLEYTYHCIIMPNKICEQFWYLFIPYLEERYKASSINTICSQIKATIAWSARYGANIDVTYDEFDLLKVKSKKISLTPDDVSRIYHLNIDSLPVRSQHKRTLIKIKDMFCLMCNCGLRYSDASRLTKEHFRMTL